MNIIYLCLCILYTEPKLVFTKRKSDFDSVSCDEVSKKSCQILNKIKTAFYRNLINLFQKSKTSNNSNETINCQCTRLHRI